MVPMISATATDSAGDGDVVVDLAHRLGERPAVGEVHEARRRSSRAGSCRRRTGPAAPGWRTTAAGTRPRRRPAPAGRPRWRCRSRARTAARRGRSATACVTALVSPPRNRFMKPRLLSCSSSAASSYSPRRMSRKTLTMPTRTTRFRIPRSVEEDPGDQRADQRRRRSAASSRRLDLPGERARRRGRAAGRARTRWSSGRGRTRSRPRAGCLPVGHQLAGGVVDGRDVVGVERVPHPRVYAVTPSPIPKTCGARRPGSSPARRPRPASPSRPGAAPRTTAAIEAMAVHSARVSERRTRVSVLGRSRDGADVIGTCLSEDIPAPYALTSLLQTVRK